MVDDGEIIGGFECHSFLHCGSSTHKQIKLEVLIVCA
jgi:hypothetical protein